jgi:MFS family permease
MNNVETDPKYGWVMVAVAFMLTALSFGALGAISVFLKPLSQEFGWTRGETSLGYTAIAFSSALFGILWGYIADRFGTRWMGLMGAVMMTVALFLLSEQRSLLQFYAFYFLFGALGHSAVGSPLFANVGFWFQRNPGLALGITASGSAIGQGVIPFLVGLSISKYGWQTAYAIMAWSYLIIAVPISLLVRESPSRRFARTPDFVDDRDFPVSEVEVVVWISLAVIFCCNCMSVPIVHLVPLLTDAGNSSEIATSVLLVLMLSGALGRILGGKLGDVVGALPAYMLMSLGQTVFVFWFPLTGNLPLVYLLAVLFGFTYSGVMSAILVCVRMMVSARLAGRAMSITAFFGWVGMGMGGFLGGLFYDLHANYVWSYSFASLMGVINLIVLSTFYIRIKQKRKSLFATATVYA